MPDNVYTTAVHGRQFNLDQLLARNEKAIAVGDMRMNARGDLLDEHNNVVQTVEEVANQYQSANKTKVQRIPLSSLDENVFMTIDQVKTEIIKQTEINKAKKVIKKNE